MEFKTIIDRINNGEYDRIKRPNLYEEGYVFDENKSVKWNREEVIKQNEKLKKESEMKREDFQDDVVKYILNSYKIDNNENIANMVYNMAHEFGHSSGYREILNETIDFADFAENIVTEIKDTTK